MSIERYKSYEPLFGNWYINGILGAGSYGTVYEIQRHDMSGVYSAALKAITIPQHPGEVESMWAEGMNMGSITSYFHQMVEEVVSEVVLMSRLKGNSNIVSYEDHTVIKHDHGVGWDILMRMELLTPLIKHVSTVSISRNEAIRFGIHICRALELCQRYNIIHRDIKPENIFISESGEYKLGDFGISRTIERTTGVLSQRGTFTYMAPEVYNGRAYGPSVDIYSLGIVMYWLLNENRAPFLPNYPEQITPRDRENAFMWRMRGETLPPPIMADRELAEIVLKMCAHDRNERYESLAQLRADLESVYYYGQGELTPPRQYRQSEATPPSQYWQSESPPRQNKQSERPSPRHCEQSEAIQEEDKGYRQSQVAAATPQRIYGDGSGAYAETTPLSSLFADADIHTPTKPPIYAQHTTPPRAGTPSQATPVYPEPTPSRATTPPSYERTPLPPHQPYERTLTPPPTPHHHERSTPPASPSQRVPFNRGTPNKKNHGISIWSIPTWAKIGAGIAALLIIVIAAMLLLSNRGTNDTPLGPTGTAHTSDPTQQENNEYTPSYEVGASYDNGPAHNNEPHDPGQTQVTYITIHGETFSTSLTELILTDNLTNADIAPLRYMTNLTELSLSGSQISDLTPLSSLTNLTSLTIAFTQASNLSPLSSLSNLTTLILEDNQISDIGPLANLTALDLLMLPNNHISDISSISNLTNLTILELSANQIVDISPLANLTYLSMLFINENHISNVTPLANLPHLFAVQIWGNPAYDFSALQHLFSLETEQPPPPAHTVHTVESGQTLQDIAYIHFGSRDQFFITLIMAANYLESYADIFPGMELAIPIQD